MVRAKFIVTSKTEVVGGWMVTLNPVIGGINESEENKTFFKYTPGGKIELQLLSDKTAESYKVGKEYYVDFTECVKAEQ